MSRSKLQRDPWFYATWEGAEILTLLEGAAMTFPEKLAWLEEANELARSLGANKTGVEVAEVSDTLRRD